jgi:D-aminopeptidase
MEDFMSEPAHTVTERLDALFQPHNRTDEPGYCVGVRFGGRSIYRRGVGMASLEQSVANAPSTRMRIGSTTKHFVSVLALMLAEEGEFDVDGNIGRYLPELPESSRAATVRQLLTHSGGLRCYIDLGFLSHGMRVRPPGSGLDVQCRQSAVNFPPGERMIYCNSGYLLVSLALERITGTPLAELLAERIFRPMRMSDTELIANDFEIHQGKATLHVRLPGGGFRRGLFPQEQMSGDGAVISTIDDMLVWLANLRGPHTLGSDELWAQMVDPPLFGNGTTSRYALGLQLSRHRGVQTIHHAGAVIGGWSQMLTVPEHKLDIVVLSNGGSISPTKLVPKIIDAVLGDDCLGVRTQSARATEFAGLVGTHYRAPSGMVLGFGEVSGDLGLRIFDNEPVLLRRAGGELTLEFEDAAAGPYAVLMVEGLDRHAPEHLQIAECGNFERFDRLSAPANAAAQLQALAGEYRSADLGSLASIALPPGGVSDRAMMQLRSVDGGTQMTLRCIADGVFAWENEDPFVPTRGVLASTVEAGVITGFKIDTVRTRHLAFERLGAAGAGPTRPVSTPPRV